MLTVIYYPSNFTHSMYQAYKISCPCLSHKSILKYKEFILECAETSLEKHYHQAYERSLYPSAENICLSSPCVVCLLSLITYKHRFVRAFIG